jgi:4'-phosphopantetheinyl transferase
VIRVDLPPCGSVELSLVRTDAIVSDARLTPDERARAARFHFERDRIRYIASHAALHELLGDREIVLAADGKPYLRDGSLHFNLSHSGDYALIAIASDAEVGVDIEQHRERVSWNEIAVRFFTKREVAVMRGEADFFRFWVMKEAVLKAAGKGLAGGLANVECLADVVTTPLGDFRVKVLDAPAGYSAAVALRM